MKWKKELEKIIYSKKRSNTEKLLSSIKNKNIPKLYRYFSFSSKNPCIYNNQCTKIHNCLKEKKRVFDYSYLSLKHNMIGLSSPLDFNDPFDSQFKLSGEFAEKILKNGLENEIYPIEITDKQMKTIKESSDIYKTSQELFGVDLKKKLEKSMLDLLDYEMYPILNTIRIACFSEVNDSILMWSHYANNHTGFCVEYDFNKLNNIKLLDNLYPVFYKEFLFDVSDVFFKSYKGTEADELDIYASVLTKNKEWNYEREWRYLSYGGDFILNVPRPESVYLGSRVSDENKNSIINLFNETNIPLFQMKPDNSEFKLNYFPINKKI